MKKVIIGLVFLSFIVALLCYAGGYFLTGTLCLTAGVVIWVASDRWHKKKHSLR